MKSLSTEQLFADLFAFFFFIRIQFKVQHVNSVAKIGKKTIASKLFCYFFAEAIFSEACANKKDCLERQPSSVIKILQQFLEYRNEKKEVYQAQRYAKHLYSCIWDGYAPLNLLITDTNNQPFSCIFHGKPQSLHHHLYNF